MRARIAGALPSDVATSVAQILSERSLSWSKKVSIENALRLDVASWIWIQVTPHRCGRACVSLVTKKSVAGKFRDEVPVRNLVAASRISSLM